MKAQPQTKAWKTKEDTVKLLISRLSSPLLELCKSHKMRLKLSLWTVFIMQQTLKFFCVDSFSNYKIDYCLFSHSCTKYKINMMRISPAETETTYFGFSKPSNYISFFTYEYGTQPGDNLAGRTHHLSSVTDAYYNSYT